MVKKSIAAPEIFKIWDERTNETFQGCNQVWYKTKWQRLSGCGPTTATHLFYYLSHTPAIESERVSMSKENWIGLMEEMWTVVTPSLRGVHKTEMFYNPLLAYMKSKGLNAEYHVCDLPKDKSHRPGLSMLLSFLEEALSNNAPIAFLNLCNGEEKNLDRWHWVTIISLEYLEDHSIFVNILDAGQIKKINLALWYNTTTLGGGFVYFTIR
jgi:hypothetical protein